MVDRARVRSVTASDISPVDESERVIRGIHPDHWNAYEDRPTSAAYRKRELSVDREGFRSVDVCCVVRPEWGFTRLDVSVVRKLGLEVVADPVGTTPPPEGSPPSLEWNPGHALIVGDKTRMIRLRDVATTLRRPGDCRAVT